MKTILLKFSAAILLIGAMLLLAPIANVLLMGEAQAQTSGQGQMAVDVELRGAGSNGNTINNCTEVTFIFRSSYTGNIGGVAFTSTDVPLKIKADNGSTLRQIPFTVTAGTLVIIEVHGGG